MLRSTQLRTCLQPAILAGLFILAAPVFSAAQAPAEQAAATENDQASEAKTQNQPEAIDLSSVPIEAQALAEQLEVFESLGDGDLIERIEAELPTLKDSIVESNRRATRAMQHSTSSGRLGAITTVLTETDRKLGGWQEQLSEELRDYENAITEATYLTECWRLTRDKAIADESPGTLLTQIRASLSSVTNALNDLKRLREEALESQGSISYELRRSSRVATKVENLIADARAGMLQATSPPMWQLFSQDRSKEMIEDVQHFISENGSALLQWSIGRMSQLMLSLSVFVISLVFLVSTKKKLLAQVGSDPQLEIAGTLVLHPISSSYLLFALSVPIFIGDRTAAFSWLLGMGSVIPLLRLIPTLIPGDLVGLARHTVWVFVIVRTAYVLSEGSSLARLLFLAAEVLIFIAGLRFLKKAKAEKGTHPIVVLACRVTLVITASALVANLFGFSLLGATLIQGVGGSAYAGLGIVAIVTASRAFFRLLAILGPLQHLNSVKRHFNQVEATVGRILFWLGLLLWFFTALRNFTLRESFITWLGSAMSHEWQFGSLAISVGSICLFLISVWGAVMISRIIRFFLENDILPRVGLPRGVPATISMMLHYGIVALGFFIALAAIGIDLSQISIVVGALGVGIGFGLQNVVNNFISGLILIFERPINIGDTVEFGTNIGKVSRIGLRSSVVRSFQGAEMIVPNGNLIAAEVINWTLSDQKRRIDLPLGVAYGTDPQTVIDLLTKTISSLDYIDAEPEPWVTFEQFGESSLDFKIRCWTDADRWLKSKSALTVEVNNALVDADITIPFPQRDVHLFPAPESPSADPSKD